jgi:hypothetical protein
LAFGVDTEQEARFLAAQNAENAFAEDNLRRVQQQSERMDDIARMLGEDVAPDAKPNALFRLLDTLDTPRQYLSGVIAKGVGIPEYQDVGILDAASKAAGEDLTTGEILRRSDILPNNPVLRGTAGFIGDVVTDPLSWLKPLGVAKQVGHLKVNDVAALKTAGGTKTAHQLYQALSEAKSKTILDELVQTYGGSTPDVAREFFQGQAAAKGAKAAETPFTQLAVLLQQRAKESAVGLGTTEKIAGILDAQNAQKAEGIAKELGLNFSDTNDLWSQLEGVVKKPRVVLSSPFANPTGASIPLFGGREIEIPGLSAISEKIYDDLAKGYYAAPVYLKGLVNDGLTKNPESMMWKTAASVGKMLSSTHKGAVSLSSLLSRRVASTGEIFGSDLARKVIREDEVARGVAYMDASKEAGFLARNLLKHPEAKTIFTDMSHTLQEASISDEAFNGALQTIKQKYPDAAEQIDEFLGGVQDLHAKILDIEGNANFFDQESLMKMRKASARGYVMQTYTFPPGTEVENAINKLTDNLIGDGDFTLRKQIQNMKLAKDMGYVPNENILDSVITRLYQHKKVMAEKEFAEKFVYQWALRPGAYEAIKKEASNFASAKRAATVAAMKQMGYPINPDEILQKQAIKISGGSENYLSPEIYERWRKVMQNGPKDTSYEFVSGEVARNGLKFTPEEALDIETRYRGVNSAAETMLGRDGNNAYTMGGGTLLSETLRKKLKGLNKKDEMFWDSLLPESLVRHLEESYNGLSYLKAMETRLGKGFESLTGPLRKFVNAYVPYIRAFKAGATLYWPGYMARNITAMPFQAIQAMSILGEAMNPAALIRNHGILNLGRNVVTEAGEKLTSKQLLAELADVGIRHDYGSVADMIEMSADMLNMYKPQKELSKYKIAKGWQKVSGFAHSANSAVERWGRTHVYTNLRMKGMSRSAAAAQTAKVMIDYTHGKTPFEKNLLNNVFFFYSFSRGNASNMFHSLVANPGVLTTQLHGHKAIAEMLTDDANFVPGEDLEKKVQTFSSAQQLTTLVGINKKTGLAKVLKGTGMPVEDLGKWGGLVPNIPNKITMGDIMQSAGDSVSSGAATVFAQTNPVVRGIFERMIFKKDMFFNRPISDETIRKIPSWQRDINLISNYRFDALPNEVWKGLDDVTKAVLGGKSNPDGTITIRPEAMTVLTYFVPGASRILSTRMALTKPGSDAGLNRLRLTSGINVQEVDPEKSIAWEEMARKKEYYETQGIPTSKRKAKARMQAEEDDTEE